jgi:hypothetical protein
MIEKSPMKSFLAILLALGLGGRLIALDISFPNAPVVGQDFQAVVDSSGDVGCENGIKQQSVTFSGSGSRMVDLGVVPNAGFFPLRFVDSTTQESKICLVSTFQVGPDNSGSGSASEATASSTALDKFFVQMHSKENLARWYANYDKADAFASNIAQMSTTGVLGVICVTGQPVACGLMAGNGWDVITNLTLDFFSHCIQQMVDVDHTLTDAEGQELQHMIKTGLLLRDLADAAIGEERIDRLLPLVDALTLDLKDPHAKLVIGLQKDTAGKAAALYTFIKRTKKL